MVTEETNRVIGERRLAALRDFAAELSRSNSEAEVFSAAERCLANTQHDFPFTAVYLCPADTPSCQLMACSGTMAGSSLTPRTIDCGSGHEVWPITRSLNRGESILMEDLETRFGDAPSGPWPKAPERAVMLPLIQAEHERPMGVFVAGLNPFLRFDEAYRRSGPLHHCRRVHLRPPKHCRYLSAFRLRSRLCCGSSRESPLHRAQHSA